MARLPSLNVWFCLNVFRQYGDTSLDSEILGRFARDFESTHWPWEPKPVIYFDPRSLSSDPSERASLHAKCLIVDRQQALITSANFTRAAQTKNIEVGTIVKYRPFVERCATYFEALRDHGVLARCFPRG